MAGVNALARDNVSKLDAMSRLSQNFMSDEVHLTKDSSFTYVNGLLYSADSIFTAEIIDLEAGTSKKSVRGIEDQEGSSLKANFEKSVKDLEKNLEELNRSMFS